MEDKVGLNYLSDAVAIVMTAVQENPVLQVISFVLTMLATAFSIMITILKFISWWRNAKADGKITDEELKDAQRILEDGKNHLNKKGDKENVQRQHEQSDEGN